MNEPLQNLKSGLLGASIPSHTATIYDSGNQCFHTTTLPSISLAIVRILQRSSLTANKSLHIASFTTTQNEILGALESTTGKKWSVKRVPASAALKEGREKLARMDFTGYPVFVAGYLFADSNREMFLKKDLANELLALPAEDLRQTIQEIVGAV
jgi:hypothetical protein